MSCLVARRAGSSAVSLLLGLAATLLPRAGEACSASSCVNGEVFPPSGVIPENAVAFVVRPERHLGFDTDAGLPRSSLRFALERNDAGAELDMQSFELANERTRLVPTQPPRAGDRIHIEYEDACDTSLGQQFQFIDVTEPAPLPTELGELNVELGQGFIELPDSGGGCWERFYASFANLSVDLSPSATPFEDALMYSLEVDGARYRSPEVFNDDELNPVELELGGSGLGRGLDRVYTHCDSRSSDANGLSQGVHLIRMVATLPTGERIETDEVELSLVCQQCAIDGGVASCEPGTDMAVDAGPSVVEPPSRPNEDPLSSDSGSGSAASPTPQMDAAAPASRRDAASDVIDPGTDQVVTKASSEGSGSGCACTVGERTSSASWLGGLLLLATLGRRRRWGVRSSRRC